MPKSIRNLPTIDLEDLRHAFLSPEGKIYAVAEWGHDAFAEDVIDVRDGAALVKLGWVKLSKGEWLVLHSITQAQLDAMHDWHLANKKKFIAAKYEVK